MARLKGRWAAEYFKKPNTVACWWDPLADQDPAFREWFVQQLSDVMGIADPAGKRVLDAATGRGRAAVAAALGGAEKVVAADISTEMLNIAHETATRAGVGHRMDLVQADLEHAPFHEEGFDVVFLLEVLLHFQQPGRVLSNLARSLVPGGVLIVTTNGANPVSRLFQPSKQGANPASKWRLTAAATVNEVMTSMFGFTWARTSATARLYREFFNAPVRPLYPWQVRKMLYQAGFRYVYHRPCPNTMLPREHRWAAYTEPSRPWERFAGS